MRASVHHTMERLGRVPEQLPAADFDAMLAYLDSLPAPKQKPPPDPEAVARGREVFVQSTCSACHVGDKLTDRSQHDLDTTMEHVDTPALIYTTMEHVDTPALIGLGHSRPCYHDGSAIDIQTLLTDRGTIHEMADTSKLSDAQVRDLAAYLESL